jgi:predicted RNA-binding protein with PUA-like domain
MTNVWLVKSEPSVYAYDRLAKEKKTRWDGVRNFEARMHLRAMKKGDLVLYYHSNVGKAVVGIARVVKEAYADPTTDEDWSVVDLAPVKALATPVPLALIKKTPKLAKIGLVTKSRLSVMPVTKAEFEEVLRLGGTKV